MKRNWAELGQWVSGSHLRFAAGWHRDGPRAALSRFSRKSPSVPRLVPECPAQSVVGGRALVFIKRATYTRRARGNERRFKPTFLQSVPCRIFQWITESQVRTKHRGMCALRLNANPEINCFLTSFLSLRSAISVATLLLFLVPSLRGIKPSFDDCSAAKFNHYECTLLKSRNSARLVNSRRAIRPVKLSQRLRNCSRNCLFILNWRSMDNESTGQCHDLHRYRNCLIRL